MDYQTINPATEEVVKTFPIISDADLDKVIAKAHELYLKDWSNRPVADRCRILGRAAEILKEKIEEYAAYLGLEVGKTPGSCKGEVNLVAGILEYYAKNAEAFLAPNSSPDFQTQKSFLARRASCWRSSPGTFPITRSCAWRGRSWPWVMSWFEALRERASVRARIRAPHEEAGAQKAPIPMFSLPPHRSPG